MISSHDALRLRGAAQGDDYDDDEARSSVVGTQRGMPRRAPSDRSYRRGSTRRTSSGVPRIAPDGTRRADEDDDDDDRPLRRRTADRSRRVHIGVRIRSPPPRAWAPADFRRNALTNVLDVLISSWLEKLRTDFTLEGFSNLAQLPPKK